MQSTVGFSLEVVSILFHLISHLDSLDPQFVYRCWEIGGLEGRCLPGRNYRCSLKEEEKKKRLIFGAFCTVY